jgi:hypothetical protein
MSRCAAAIDWAVARRRRPPTIGWAASPLEFASAASSVGSSASVDRALAAPRAGRVVVRFAFFFRRVANEPSPKGSIKNVNL